MNKKTAIWQIWIPLILVIILVGVLAYLLFSSSAGKGGNQISLWSDVSLIYLLTPVIALSAIVPILCIACISFINLSRTKIHEWLKTTQEFSSNVKQKTHSVDRKAITIFSGSSVWFKTQKKDKEDGRKE